MKTRLFKITAIALCACLSFSACKKDKGDDNTVIYNPEQSKVDIEQAGMELSNELQEMKDGKAFNAILQLANLVNGGELKNYTLKATNVESKLKGYDIPDEFAEEIKENSGLFIWNGEDFEQADVQWENKATYKFPFDDKGENNCEITAEVKFDDNYNNAPKELTTTLKIEGVECLKISFNATYSNEYPTYVKEAFTIDNYSFESVFNRTNSSISESASFKHGSKILLSCSGEAKGDFNDNNIDRIIEEEGDLDNDFYASILGKTAFSAQIMNLKMVASALPSDLLKIDEGENTQESMQKFADEVNKYIDCSIVNTSNNSKIADVKVFVEKEVYEYGTYEWDEDGNYQYITKEGEDYDIIPKLVFADGSTMDFEDYVEKGFDNVKRSFENLFDDLVKVFEKYDLD
ncbi:MAG: hypothetical protein J6V74_06390 [Bacteroidales bacterium]|nr:hypothetical protein [Bacteroidales bacterium]